MLAESAEIGGRNDLSISPVAVALDDFHKFQREGPLHFGGQGSPGARTFNRIRRNQHFARRQPGIPAHQGVDHGCRIVGCRQSSKFHISRGRRRVYFIAGCFVTRLCDGEEILTAAKKIAAVNVAGVFMEDGP